MRCAINPKDIKLLIFMPKRTLIQKIMKEEKKMEGEEDMKEAKKNKGINEKFVKRKLDSF